MAQHMDGGFQLCLTKENRLLVTRNSELVEGIKRLVEDWRKRARANIPESYAGRGLEHKYLKLDNADAGMDECADELESLLTPDPATTNSKENSNG